MKLFFYNDKLGDPSCHGSFCESSRNLNGAAQKLDFFANPDKADFIIHMDAFNLTGKFGDKLLVPFLVSEYNLCPHFLIDQLAKHPIAFAISQQAKDSFVNAGADSSKIHVVHLGSNPRNWPDLNQRSKNPVFTFLTHNTSNNRSGFEILIPAFLEWAADKEVQLVIKDQNNPKLIEIIKTIDSKNKIKYIGENINHHQLVSLYNECHCHIYANSVTSFGLTVLDTALTGLPQIISHASALPEFTSEEYVNYIKCHEQSVDALLLAEYNAFGLINNLPALNQYKGQLLTSRPIYSSILEQLDFAYNNYSQLVEKNKKFAAHIRNNLTWENSVKKIVEVLK